MLINCPDCLVKVSDKAPTCPGCGCPLGKPVEVVTTNGATGKFLDPGANARSYLGCLAVMIILPVILLIFSMLKHSF